MINEPLPGMQVVLSLRIVIQGWEVSQKLRALTPLLEYQGSILAPTWQFTNFYNYSSYNSRESKAPFCPLWAPGRHVVHIHVCWQNIYTHTQIFKQDINPKTCLLQTKSKEILHSSILERKTPPPPPHTYMTAILWICPESVIVFPAWSPGWCYWETVGA